MSDYWKSRKVDDIFDKNTDEVIGKLKKIYRKQGRQIQKAITDIYITMLEDGGISTTELYKFNRFKNLLDEINTILKGYGEQEIKVISKGLEQATKDIIGDIVENSNISFALINENAIQEIVNTKFKGESFSKRIWKNRNNLGKLIEKNLQNIIASGMNKDKAVAEIMDIHNSSFYNADRLVRTETMRCINSGQVETYKARGRTHGYYIYAGDKRTCDKCKRIGEETKANPLPLEELEPVHHPNCRCTILPVVDLKKYESNVNIISESLFPKKIANVKCGNKMTRDEANHNKPNPNFNKNDTYKINCQTCVVVYEARLRGYDVQALGNTKGSKLEELSKYTNKAWIDINTGNFPEYIFDNSINTSKKAYDFINQVVEPNKRYTIQFIWKGRGLNGHIICLDRDENNELRFYDPQIGETYNDSQIKEYLNYIKYTTTINGNKIPIPPKIIRVDDKGFNLDMVNYIMEGAK